MTNLQRLKILLGIDVCETDKDNLLTLILEDAANDYLSYTHQTSITGAEALVCRMAVVRYNLVGEEGLNSQSYNGLSESIEGYGSDLLTSINAHRRVMLV